MTYVEAITICEKIESGEYDNQDRIRAIRKILSMETINAVKKDTLRRVIQWFFDQCVQCEDDAVRPDQEHEEICCRTCAHDDGNRIVHAGQEPCHSCLMSESGEIYPDWEPREDCE